MHMISGHLAKPVYVHLSYRRYYEYYFHSRTHPDIPIQHNTEGSLRDFINWKFKHADQIFYLYYEKVLMHTVYCNALCIQPMCMYVC